MLNYVKQGPQVQPAPGPRKPQLQPGEQWQISQLSQASFTHAVNSMLSFSGQHN